jgi:hypothetical protein
LDQLINSIAAQNVELRRLLLQAAHKERKNNRNWWFFEKKKGLMLYFAACEDLTEACDVQQNPPQYQQQTSTTSSILTLLSSRSRYDQEVAYGFDHSQDFLIHYTATRDRTTELLGCGYIIVVVLATGCSL